MPALSVILPTHNPDRGRLAATLQGLAHQSLARTNWELLVIDNCSRQPLDAAWLTVASAGPVRLVREETLGLSAARRRGFLEAAGSIAVLVDDDNVLDPTYLAEVRALFQEHSRLGAAGGPVRPSFERDPAGWTREFWSLLALRDLGPSPLVATTPLARNGVGHEYPACAPIGAGMAIRREAWEAWLLRRSQDNPFADRQGHELTSSGDNDIIMCALRAGWQVGYFPSLALTHLIPAARLEKQYLGRLNRGIQRSWTKFLLAHDACPWPRLSPWAARLRIVKAWLTHRPWTSAAAFVRWQGARGHFEGRAEVRLAAPSSSNV